MLAKEGFKLVDPGRYQNLTDDFSAQITAFPMASVEIVTGVVLPPDFTTFWTQANQKGFKPKAVERRQVRSCSRSALEALGKTGNNLSSEVWWSPSHPVQVVAERPVGGRACRRLHRRRPAGNGRSRSASSIRCSSSAVDTLKRAADPTDPAALVKSIAKIDLQTITGPIKFGQENVPPFAARQRLARRRWSAASGSSRTTASTTSSSSTTRPIRRIPVAGKMEPIA